MKLMDYRQVGDVYTLFQIRAVERNSVFAYCAEWEKKQREKPCSLGIVSLPTSLTVRSTGRGFENRFIFLGLPARAGQRSR